VLCSDSPNPSNPRAYPGYAARAYARAGAFGPEYTWDAERCARWPAATARDRYVGPWNRRTAGVILLVGITGDPDTPYQGSVALSRDLARVRLLTVRGYGHTAGSNPSACALRYEIRYALTGALPPPGTICHENQAPFPSRATTDLPAVPIGRQPTYGSIGYPICMVKTTVYLPGDLKQRLEQASQLSGQSEATIIRSALEGWLDTLLPRPAPHWGTMDFGDPQLAVKVDEALAGGFGEQ